MTMTAINLPSRNALKAQAKRLRTSLSAAGTKLPHAVALETVAKQWGFRDWNTLSSAASQASTPMWQIGQKVSGVYLGHAFTGQIKSVSQRGANHARLTLVFDAPVDVVTSERFSSLRRQINATVNSDGRTFEKTSDGQPHLVLDI